MSNNSIFKLENLYNVKDWVVVVTGAGSGIELMCAQAFANNGARVCELRSISYGAISDEIRQISWVARKRNSSKSSKLTAKTFQTVVK